MRTKIKLLNREYIYSLLLFFILFTPNIYVLFYFQEIAGSFQMLTAYFCLSVLTWIFPFIFLPKKVFFGIGFLFLLFSPLEIIFVKSIGIPLTTGFMEAVYRTNSSETLEQFSSHIGFGILFLCLIATYIFLFFKIKNTYFHSKVRIAIAASFLIFNGVLFYKMYQIHASSERALTEKLDSALTSTLLKYNKIYPIDLVLNSYKTFLNIRKASLLANQIENFSFNAKSENDTDEEEIYVLIIGETARFANFHINGYNRDTTPNLDTIKNLLSFTDVYATANLTSISVPMLITRATPQDRSPQNKEKTILDAFKEAGYYTAWFANQNSEYPFINRLRKNVNLFKANQFDVNIRGYYDEEVIPKFETVLKKKEKKKFIVIHSLGSHFRYTNRYPKEFEKFSPVMAEFGYNDYNLKNKKEIVNSYDNSIYYTDFFLSQIIESLKQTNKKAVLLYVSDHGENLYDDDKTIGHGTSKPTKYEYHIPYFIWYSKQYEERNNQKTEQLKKHLDSPSSSTVTFHTLLNLANISFADSNESQNQSLASEKYQIPEERVMINSEEKIIPLK